LIANPAGKRSSIVVNETLGPAAGPAILAARGIPRPRELIGSLIDLHHIRTATHMK
jgi:hypothetical protein